ncbi:MAG: hypothetical protein M3273_04735 [Actinomycetota bacterium]|nr:hypothetical protein [Actinomycetota bacterium]
MNPLLKKVIAAVAIKEGIEKIQDMRRPKPSLWSRISPFAAIAALGGALFYLNKSGRLGPVVGQVKEKVGSGSPGTSSWEGNGATTSSSPSPTTTSV